MKIKIEIVTQSAGTIIGELGLLITVDQFKKVCSKTPIAHAQILVPLFNRICPQYGINTKDIFHEFFANLCEESREFQSYEEGLTYTRPERLMAVWPSRFKTRDQALLYVNNPKGLAMKVYGSRRDLGNLTAEDGWTFRGSGPIQITGRSNFANFASFMAKTFSVVKPPEMWAGLLRQNDEWGIHSACWIFSIAKRLNDEAERDEMIEIVKRINGGLTNLASRMHYYQLAKKYIV